VRPGIPNRPVRSVIGLEFLKVRTALEKEKTTAACFLIHPYLQPPHFEQIGWHILVILVLLRPGFELSRGAILLGRQA
jgi:hypothetical protein